MKFKDISKLITKITKYADKNSPAILTGVAIVGVVATAVAAYKTGIKANDILKEHKKEMDYVDKKDLEAVKAVKKKTVKKMVPTVIPPIVMGSVTIACCLGSNKISSKRIAILSAAYQMSEKACDELNKKMVEVLGEKKTRAIKDKIVKDKVDKNPQSKNDTIIVGNGDVMCYDCQSGRYFSSNAQKIKQATLELSEMIQNEGSATLNDFYDILDAPGLPRNDSGDAIGWNVNNLKKGVVDINITAILNEGQPCLALDYDAGIVTNWYGEYRR